MSDDAQSFIQRVYNIHNKHTHIYIQYLSRYLLLLMQQNSLLVYQLQQQLAGLDCWVKIFLSTRRQKERNGKFANVHQTFTFHW